MPRSFFLVRGQHVVHAAVTDVIGPAVAAEDPDGLLGQQVLVGEDELAAFAALLLGMGFQRGNQLFAGLAGAFRVVHVLEPFLGRGHHVFNLADLGHLGDDFSQLGAALGRGEVHAEAELRVVLEQAVGPGGSEAGPCPFSFVV